MPSCCYFTDVYRWELRRDMQDPTTHLCFFFLRSFILGWYLQISFSNWQFPHHFAADTKWGMETSWHFALIQGLWPLGCEQWEAPWRQLGLRRPVSTEAGKPSRHREGRDPLSPTCAPAAWSSFTLMLNSFSGNSGAWSFTSLILMLIIKDLSTMCPVKRLATSK